MHYLELRKADIWKKIGNRYKRHHHIFHWLINATMRSFIVLHTSVSNIRYHFGCQQTFSIRSHRKSYRERIRVMNAEATTDKWRVNKLLQKGGKLSIPHAMDRILHKSGNKWNSAWQPHDGAPSYYMFCWSKLFVSSVMTSKLRVTWKLRQHDDYYYYYANN